MSSRDAHKLEGRFRSEKGSIFNSVEHTEILQLRQHVHSLTGGFLLHCAALAYRTVLTCSPAGV